jgi:hypothetical protein
MGDSTIYVITAFSTLVSFLLLTSALLKAQEGRLHTAALRGGIAVYILYLTSKALLHG